MPTSDPSPRPTRGELFLKTLRRHRLSQFRLSALFLLTFVAACLLALPRIFGWAFDDFFQTLWVAAFGLAPLLALTSSVFLPRTPRRVRFYVATGVLLAAVIPFLLRVTLSGNRQALQEVVLNASCVFWIPQAVCILLVWLKLFRQ